MIFVIGSGPAGVACASALLERGAQVTMLDAGLELEPDRRRRLIDLQSVAFPSWDEKSLSVLREGAELSPGGIRLKLAYGSQFPYRDPIDQPMSADGVHAKLSFARGGLSNVWGASVLPYRTEDIYTSSQSLVGLRANRLFTYRSGLVVEQLKEIGSQVEISGRAAGDRSEFKIRADQVFVACGVLSTARIMLTSLEAYDQPIQAIDNFYFLMPLLRYISRADVREEPLYTLAQVFIEIL